MLDIVFDTLYGGCSERTAVGYIPAVRLYDDEFCESKRGGKGKQQDEMFILCYHTPSPPSPFLLKGHTK